MSDVARRAGVSRSAVSFALNGSNSVGLSDATVRRVWAAAEELGFRPNRQARNLRLQRAGQLALHVTLETAENSFAMSLLPALLQAAEAEGFYMLTFTGPDQAQAQFDELLYSGSVDAFIFTDSTIDDRRAKFLADRQFPFVCYGRLSPDLPQCWVDMDNNAATTLLVDHFLDNGAQTVAFISPAHSAYWDKERAASFDRRMRQRKHKPIAISLRNTATDIRSTLDQLVDHHSEPLALIVSSRSLATALLTAIRSRGLTVGTDIAVGVYDAPAIPWMDDPALTTVSVDSKTGAAALLSRCLTEIRTGSGEQPGEYLSPQLHVGISA